MLPSLSQDVLVYILTFCSPKDWINVSCTCRRLYLMANDEEFCKSLLLNLWSKNIPINFSTNWRHSLLKKLFSTFQQTDLWDKLYILHGSQLPQLQASIYKRHVNIQNYTIPCDIVKEKLLLHIDGASTTKAQFKDLYEMTSTPVLIMGIMDSWKAKDHWSPEFFLKNYPESIFLVSTAKEKVPMRFRDYYHYIHVQHDEFPLYIFDSKFGEKNPELLEHYKIPNVVDEDLLSLLGSRRPSFRWLIVGPSRTGTPWHQDPFGTSAWNALTYGRKRWAFYPPEIVPPGVSTVLRENGDREYTSMSALSWYIDIYPCLKPHERPIECIQESGQVLFVPSGWWHLVINLDTTVAVTQNFVSSANLKNVLDEMKQFDSKLYTHFKGELLKCGKYAELLHHIDSDNDAHISEVVGQILKGQGIEIGPFSDDVITIRNKATTVVLIDNFAIKLFHHKEFENQSFLREIQAYHYIKDAGLDLTNYPSLIGYGSELNISESANPKPFEIQKRNSFSDYIIFNRIAGERWGDVPIHMISEKNWDLLISWLGTLLRDFRRLSNLVNDISMSEFQKNLLLLQETCSKRHESWGHLPKSMIDKISPFISSQLKTSENMKCCFLHCDINADNIMGDWFHVQNSNGTMDQLWIPTRLIDFADSTVGDSFYELIPIYATVLQCDRDRFRKLLLELNMLPQCESSSLYLCNRLMAYLLLWPFNGPIQWVWKFRSLELGGVSTFEEMAVVLFQPIR